MLVLGIESSCDETGVALYDTERGLLAHHLHTQMAMHAEYGGVVPELASRDHIRRLVPLTEGCLKEAGVSYGDVDAVAFTQGPGLVVRCWRGRVTPMPWLLRWISPLSPSIIWKDIYFPPCWRMKNPNFLLSPCWFRAGILRLWPYGESAITNF